ncbi:MAG: SH3 domain-containing protein [Schwartzia sp.]|nr:SH3 domain-containing protein [Schwartzia sp. (in: firmicutes)]
MKSKKILALLLAAAMGFGCMPEMPAATAQVAVSASEAADPLLVDKTHPLPDGYEAGISLVTAANCFGEEFQIERETYEHFLELRADLLRPDATTEGAIQIEIAAAYRDAGQQQAHIEALRAAEGGAYADAHADPPGFSEQQTGLALDVVVVENGAPKADWYNIYETSYQQIHRKLAEHGFILRYPPGKSGVTGHAYDSGHIRYVGKETARKIYLQGLALEEYLAGGEETRRMAGALGSAEYWTRRNSDGEKTMSEGELAAIRETMRAKSDLLADMANYPDTVTGDHVREKIAAAREGIAYYNMEELYGRGGVPVSEESVRRADDNCALDEVPERASVRFAFPAKKAHIRYLPESSPWYEDAYDWTYDLLQGFTANAGEPLAVLAESRDKKFCFVEARQHVGWVDVRELVFAPREQWMKYADPEHFLVITANRKKIEAGGSVLTFRMGDRLPLVQPEPQEDGTWLVSVPTALAEVPVRVPADDTVHKGWLPCSENNLIRQSFRFLGDIFGWGGMQESVDCSLFTACVYRSVGVELPTDSVDQQLAMPWSVELEGMGAEEQLAFIKTLRPGDTLYAEGHAMMYLGRDDSGKPRIVQSGSSKWFPGEGEDGTALKYYVRKVSVEDFFYNAAGHQTALDRVIAAAGLRGNHAGKKHS